METIIIAIAIFAVGYIITMVILDLIGTIISHLQLNKRLKELNKDREEIDQRITVINNRIAEQARLNRVILDETETVLTQIIEANKDTKANQ